MPWPERGGGWGEGRASDRRARWFPQTIGLMAAHKWVYHFTEGPAAARSAHGEPRDLLGGKGAGAAEMTKAGMPVPPGFTITTEACRAYLANKGKFPPGKWEQTPTPPKPPERQTHNHL